jgi:hypothetical protein
MSSRRLKEKMINRGLNFGIGEEMTYMDSHSVTEKKSLWVFHLGWDIGALGMRVLSNQLLAWEKFRGPWEISKNLVLVETTFLAVPWKAQTSSVG